MSEKVICPQCNSKNDGDSEFCVECGAKLLNVKTDVSTPSLTQQELVEKGYTHPRLRVFRISLGITGLIFIVVFTLLSIFLWYLTIFASPCGRIDCGDLIMNGLFMGAIVICAILFGQSVHLNKALGKTGLIIGVICGLSQLAFIIYAAIEAYLSL